MPTITVHHLDSSRSQRILWLLEELELTYDIRQYKRHRSTMRAPAELKDIHPLGKAPVVTVDDDVFAESGAIIEAILDRFGEGRLRPEPGTKAHEQYRYFLHYAEGSLTPPLLIRLITNQLTSPKVPFFVRPLTGAVAKKIDGSFTQGELDLHGAYLDGVLAEREWFAGDEISGADVQMSFPVEAAVARGSFDKHSHVVRWLRQVQARPAYKRAVERGGPQTLLS